MKHRKVMVFAVAAGVLMTMSAPALAHVGTSPGEVPAGQTSEVGFRIGHGCDDSPTVMVAMQIPEGVSSVAPRAKEGWTVETEEGAEGVTQVTWSGGSLDSHQYDEFVIRASFDGAEGDTVHFPVVQTCEEGEYAWIQIPEDGGAEPDEPAPAVSLVGASAADSGTGDPLTWAALGMGAVGVVLGGAALVASRRRP